MNATRAGNHQVEKSRHSNGAAKYPSKTQAPNTNISTAVPNPAAHMNTFYISTLEIPLLTYLLNYVVLL